MVNMGKSSAKICVPFGTETMENDPYTVGMARNYTAGTGDRQNTSAQAKERNRQTFQRRMAQKVSRIHVAEQETSQICGAEQATSRISGDEPRLRAALADIEDIEELLEYGAPPVVYRGGWPVDCASCLYALIPYPSAKRYMGLTLRPPPRRRGPLCVVRAARQGTGSYSSSCLRIFSALDGWEDVRDPVLLVDTSELF